MTILIILFDCGSPLVHKSFVRAIFSLFLELFLTNLLSKNGLDAFMLLPGRTFLINVLKGCLLVLSNAGCDILAVLLHLHLFILVVDDLRHTVHDFLDSRTSLGNRLLSPLFNF